MKTRSGLSIIMWAALLVRGGAQTPDVGLRKADAARAESLPLTSSVAARDRAAVEGAPLAAPKLKGDEEYGEQMILTRRANWEPWSFVLDAQYFYTDNVALVPEGAVDDFYLRSGLVAQYTNRIGGDWFLDAVVSNYFYLHDEFEFFDFHMLRAEGGVLRRLPWLSDAFLSARYSWYRISESDFESGAFQEHVGSVALQKIWKIARGQQFVAGTNADISLAAEPEEPGRNEYSAFVGWKLRLTEHFSVQASYRAAFYDYTGVDRRDWNHTMLLGCSYTLTDWARLEVSASGSWNRADDSFFDYDNLVAGAGVSFRVAF